ncbi:MAG: hypothetical protein AAB375_02350 [Patescibacteria group bacterium]
MVKAIRFADVKQGDVVSRGLTEEYERFTAAESAEPFEQTGVISIRLKNGGKLLGNPDELIGLLHRPWPEGKTDRKWRKEIEVLLLIAWRAVEEDNWQHGPDYGRSDLHLAALHKAMDAYELGKPAQAGKPLESDK